MTRLLTRFSFLLFTVVTLPAFGQQIITTFAGGGPVDNSPATSAAVGCFRCYLAVNSAGVYVSSGNRVFKVKPAGNIFTVAGNSLEGYSGDGGPATNATFSEAEGVALDSNGNLYIADQRNQRVRRVDTSGNVSTVAGNGTAGFSGDGGLAINAELSVPTGLAVDNLGNLYIADTSNYRVRKVNAAGIISTVAGNGVVGFSGDGGPAVSAELNFPTGLVAKGGNLYIADAGNNRIRKVNSSGKISTVAGNGIQGFGGDGGPATSAELAGPWSVALHAGNLYIADLANHRIRKVDSLGKISTVAGNGAEGYGGDGAPATEATLAWPYSIGVDGSGNLYIADSAEQRVRKINTSGTISTFAGNGTAGFSGDGGAATRAQLGPADVASDGNGNLYIADTGNQRIRKVDASGIISTVAEMASKVSAEMGVPPRTPHSGAPTPWPLTVMGISTSPTPSTSVSEKWTLQALSRRSPEEVALATAATAAPPRKPNSAIPSASQWMAAGISISPIRTTTGSAKSTLQASSPPSPGQREYLV